MLKPLNELFSSTHRHTHDSSRHGIIIITHWLFRPRLFVRFRCPCFKIKSCVSIIPGRCFWFIIGPRTKSIDPRACRYTGTVISIRFIVTRAARKNKFILIILIYILLLFRLSFYRWPTRILFSTTRSAADSILFFRFSPSLVCLNDPILSRSFSPSRS